MIYFALAFDTPMAAERAVATLEHEGYEASSEIGHDGKYWTVSAVPQSPLSDVKAARTRMEMLAATFGGDFLGHGGSFQVALKQRREPPAHG